MQHLLDKGGPGAGAKSQIENYSQGKKNNHKEEDDTVSKPIYNWNYFFFNALYHGVSLD